MIKGAIFDVDGTLLDTMPVWTHAGVRYLKSLGIEAEAGLSEKLFKMTADMAATYMKEQYGLTQSEEEICKGILRMVEDFYFHEADFKPGALELMEDLKAAGIPMTVATSTNQYCIVAAFDRLGYTDYFDAILTCPELETHKSEPDIFFAATNAMGTKPEETWVFEDGLYAVKTAKTAGFRTVGIFDEVSKADQPELEALSDIYVESLEGFFKEHIEKRGKERV